MSCLQKDPLWLYYLVSRCVPIFVECTRQEGMPTQDFIKEKRKEKEDCWKLIKEQIGGMVIDSIDVVKVFYRKYMSIPKILKE